MSQITPDTKIKLETRRWKKDNSCQVLMLLSIYREVTNKIFTCYQLISGSHFVLFFQTSCMHMIMWATLHAFLLLVSAVPLIERQQTKKHSNVPNKGKEEHCEPST